MSGWLKHPAPPHICHRPAVKRDHVGGIWRCDCKKLWVYRTGWYFGEFPPWFYGTVAQWHKARWWERFRWHLNKPLDEVDSRG